MRRLSDILQVRITPELTERVKSEAARLNIRPADVVRYALAAGLAAGLAIGDRQSTAAR